MIWKTTLEILESLQIILSNYFSKNKLISGHLKIASILLLGVFFNSSLIAQTAPVIVPSGGFAIDGYLKANHTVSGIGDWLQNEPGAGGYILNNDGTPLNVNTTLFVNSEKYGSDDDSFTGGSKANTSPNEWKWTLSNTTGKGDLHHGMYHLAQDAEGNQWIIVGADRESTTGAAYIDFGFYQKTISLDETEMKFVSEGLAGGRTENDILLSIEFEQGSPKVAKVTFYLWKNTVDDKGNSVYAFLPIISSSTKTAVNQEILQVPYKAFGYTEYQPGQFMETAINLSEIFSNFNPCVGIDIKTLLIKSKQAGSLNANLNDFIKPIQVKLGLGTAKVSYEGSPVCSASEDITPTITGVTGGFFTSSSTNLKVDLQTGTVDVSESLPGTYTVTYTYNSNPLSTTKCPKITSVTVTITNKATPAFSFATAYCEDNNAATLPLTDDNGYAGTWFPLTISTTTIGDTDYIFTPDTGVCAGPLTVTVTITNKATPVFSFATAYCEDDNAATLP
ncbi:MAG: hypothetical protein JJE07_08670, partial [Flavobacteriaceae bacterium]|nr:hypothetical protein [Flavobacteriaceae bacterium]